MVVRNPANRSPCSAFLPVIIGELRAARTGKAAAFSLRSILNERSFRQLRQERWPPKWWSRPPKRPRRCRSRAGSPRDFHPRRPRAQPQEYRSRHPARPAGGVHRAVRLGQILARLRHHLCRGPAPLRREPVGLRAAVPGDDAEAGRRPDRRPLARHLHRAENHFAQSALDGRHRHRDPRLHAASVGARRRALLAGDRAADREPDRVADGRPHPGAAGGHAALSAGAGGARAEGRVPQGARRLYAQGLPARQSRRPVLRDRRGAGARQEVQPRHRRGGRPPGGAAGHFHAAGGFAGAGAQARRRAGGGGACRWRVGRG